MDITENEKAMKIAANAAAALWAVTAGLMASPLSIPYLGWALLVCHLTSASAAYCLKDMKGDNAAGWVLTVLCCPPAAPILMRKDVDGFTRLGAAAAVVLIIFGWVVLRFFPAGPSRNVPAAVLVLVLYFFCIVFAVRIAGDRYRNVWLWGIGCAVFPPLLLLLVFLETDFEEVPGGRVVILLGKAIALILTPLVWLALRFGGMLSPVWGKICDLFPGSSSGSFGENSSSVSKSCGACGKPVSALAMAGGRCPHCGVYWSAERTTRK
jgi:hypothetical protein